MFILERAKIGSSHRNSKITLSWVRETYCRVEGVYRPRYAQISGKRKVKNQNKDGWLKLTETQGNWDRNMVNMSLSYRRLQETPMSSQDTSLVAEVMKIAMEVVMKMKVSLNYTYSSINT
jgi:hypothetical protein